ncbi:uncharacterized protein BDZ83DRAFT_43372 [Colletotrichum acutatum]|uniref:Uncharacterized protein n=1 Tax=Glomerella acutata TaxID=27357 RepID=A0AAD8XAW3_GLOAC|nr:uncharacterized protein BDZ83DRAFT_43372 [Colletotrichum acutatum]KAK1716123.1 hypothetical protein BDZ83DRAFT_43372 [Colletotrichum acutatum]
MAARAKFIVNIDNRAAWIPYKVICPPLKGSRPALVPSIAWPRMLPVVSPHQVRTSHSQVVATASVYPPRTSWSCRSFSLSCSQSGCVRSCQAVQRVSCLFLITIIISPKRRVGDWQGVALAETGVGCVPHLIAWLRPAAPPLYLWAPGSTHASRSRRLLLGHLQAM